MEVKRVDEAEFEPEFILGSDTSFAATRQHGDNRAVPTREIRKRVFPRENARLNRT